VDEQTKQAVITLISLLVGFVAVPLINALKGQFKLKDNAALWLTLGVSVVIATAVLIGAGVFLGLTPNFTNIVGAITAILSMAMYVYGLIKKRQESPDPLPLPIPEQPPEIGGGK
jgi:predicted neutral ceramidase superfamily lipid hydrolase